MIRKLLLLVTLAGLPITAMAQIKYVLTDLGTLGGTSSSTTGINSLGQVTGGASTSGGETHAYRTAPNQGITLSDDFGTLGGTFSVGSAINDAGQVAGSSSTGSTTHAFRSSTNFAPLALTDLGTFDGTSSSFGSGINFSGQVTGEAHVANTAACFFVFSNSVFRTTSTSTVSGGSNLGTLLPNNCRSAQGWAINDAGVVVGESATVLATGQPNHAFRATGNSPMADLHPGASFSNSIAVGVNNIGQIVGTVTVGPAFSPTDTICYRTTPGDNITFPRDDLGSLGGGFCSARAINGAGDVVGQSSTGSAIHGFIYTGGSMVDLNSLVVADPSIFLAAGTGINNAGQISANGIINGTVQHGFRLDPSNVAVANLITLLSDPDLALTNGQIASLTDKLQNAQTSVEQGLNKQAINQLNAFVNSVQSSVKNGKMSAPAGATLIARANAIIEVL